VVPKILGGAAVAAVLVAGLAGYGIGASRIDDPQLDRPLPSVLVPLPDGTARDTRDAECAVEVGLDAVTLTAVTCTWADGGEVTLTTDGIR
jgi:hypothetical protein